MFSLFIFSRAGEFILVFLVLAFAAAVPLIIGTIVFVTLRKNRLSRASWQKLSGEIGFHMKNPRHLEMTGMYNGLETKLSIGSRRVGGGEDSHMEFFTYCVSRFPKSLRFAMQISAPRGFSSKVLSSHEMRVGHANFDKNFEMTCYDVRVLQRLLLSDFDSAKTGNLMGELMLARESFDIVQLNDEKVYVETYGQERNPAVLKNLLAVANGVARRFKEAREQFPPMDWENALSQNWNAFANQYQLTFEPENVVLEGTYKGYPLSVAVHCEPGKWMTSLHVRYPRPLQIGFNIYPELSIYKVAKIFGFQDIKAGHTDFDKAYVVKAKNIQVAKMKMTPEFCIQMVALDKHTHAISLTDEEMKMTLNQVLGDTNSLKSYIEAMISAMKKLEG